MKTSNARSASRFGAVFLSSSDGGGDNLDTCPAGIATQNPELRKRFAGKPEYVENFMRYIAQELREYMAKLGVKTVDELVGRGDLLKKRENLSEKQSKINLDCILNNPFDGRKQKVIFGPGRLDAGAGCQAGEDHGSGCSARPTDAGQAASAQCRIFTKESLTVTSETV